MYEIKHVLGGYAEAYCVCLWDGQSPVGHQRDPGDLPKLLD
jgi:hypothetical protein